MTKIYEDFYESADWKEQQNSLMTKLEFGKQRVTDRITKSSAGLIQYK